MYLREGRKRRGAIDPDVARQKKNEDEKFCSVWLRVRDINENAFGKQRENYFFVFGHCFGLSVTGVFVTDSLKQNDSHSLWKFLPSVALTPQGCGERLDLLFYKLEISPGPEKSLLVV